MKSLPDTRPISELLFSDEAFLRGGGIACLAEPYAKDSAVQMFFSIYLLLDETGQLNYENYCEYIQTMRKCAEGYITYEFHLVNCVTHRLNTGKGSAIAACKKADVYNRMLMDVVFKELHGILEAPHLFEGMIRLFRERTYDNGNQKSGN